MTLSVEYFRIAEGEPLPDISAFRPFKAVVIIAAEHSLEWRSEVSKWLVESGCLYLMAWGEDSVGLEDDVDWARMAPFPEGDIPGAQFVMTTSHPNEPLKEVFWYAGFCAQHPELDLPHTLIIHLSAWDKRVEMLACFAAANDGNYLPD